MSTGKIRPLSGFPELLPAERIVEQHFLDLIRATFERHGFASLETRAVEPLERLTGTGGDTDKQIYAVERLARDGVDAGEPALGLHFDLTVPFARYVVENAGRLVFPFKRYQIQRVWRGERPQEGRYREFTQCDIDVVDVGDLAPHFEAELPLVVADAFAALPVGPFVIEVNNRQIPEGFYAGIGLRDVPGTLRVLDKLDKVGPVTVRAMLLDAGATPGQADQCLALASVRSADPEVIERRVRALGVEHPTLEAGLAALGRVLAAGNAAAPGVLVADLRIARGLDYYTGTVYETTLLGYESWGSFCSGGRYDTLATDGTTTYPGVGISIGLTRLLGLLLGKNLVRASRATPACVLVAVRSEADRPASQAVARALRSRGIPCDVSPAAPKYGKQIRYADRRGIPFVWFPGDAGAGQVRDIRSGEQLPADPAAWTPPAEDLRPRVTRVPP